MHKTIHVELVGGESTSVLGIPGTVFVAGAAVIAAVLAALVTIWKMRRDLAHDREMRDRDDARNTLYSALDGVVEATGRVLQLKEATLAVARALDEEEPSEALATTQRTFDRARDELNVTVTRFNTLFIQTLVRFKDERFGTAIQVLQEDVETILTLFSAGRERSLTKPELKEVSRVEDEFATGVGLFSVLSSEWFTEDDEIFSMEEREILEKYLARADGG